MVIQAARPAPTSSCASCALSKSPGIVVMAITNSLMPLFSPCTADEKLIQRIPAMLPDPPAESTPVRPHGRRPIRTSQEIRTRRRRWISYGLFAFSLVLVVNAVVGENGYLATLRARQEYDAL